MMVCADRLSGGLTLLATTPTGRSGPAIACRAYQLYPPACEVQVALQRAGCLSGLGLRHHGGARLTVLPIVVSRRMDARSPAGRKILRATPACRWALAYAGLAVVFVFPVPFPSCWLARMKAGLLAVLPPPTRRSSDRGRFWRLLGGQIGFNIRGSTS